MRRMAMTAVIAWMCVMGAGAQAQEARALLDKTLKAYHDLNSYSGKFSTDINVVGAKNSKLLGAVSSDLLYKRPNKISLKVSSTSVETSVYSDGGKMVVYLENYKKYSTGPTAPNMSAMLALLRERAGVDSMLDPLYFLSATSLPTQLTNLTMQGNATVNGKTVSVVSGSWIGAPPAYAAKNVFLQKNAHWTLWIDKATFLLQKIAAEIPAVIQQPVKQKDGKVVTAKLAVKLEMRGSVIDSKPNPPVEDKVFAFTPPSGATEQKSVKDLLATPNTGAGK